jgi:transcriptional regulator with XRE-family HTH domain
MPLDACNKRRYKWHKMTHPLQTWLINRGMTQTAFAASIGISRMAVWRILRGKPALTVSMLRRVSDATGIPVAALVSGDGTNISRFEYVETKAGLE